MGQQWLTCFINLDKLDDAFQDLLAPQVVPFNPDLYRFQFNFFKQQFITINEAAHRLSSITGVDEFTVQQKFMVYRRDTDRINQDDFVTLAYIIFRGGENDLVYFYLQDKNYNGRVPKELIAAALREKKRKDPDVLIERHCAGLKFVTAELWMLMLDDSKV